MFLGYTVSFRLYKRDEKPKSPIARPSPTRPDPLLTRVRALPPVGLHVVFTFDRVPPVGLDHESPDLRFDTTPLFDPGHYLQGMFGSSPQTELEVLVNPLETKTVVCVDSWVEPWDTRWVLGSLPSHWTGLHVKGVHIGSRAPRTPPNRSVPSNNMCPSTVPLMVKFFSETTTFKFRPKLD